MTPRGAGLPGGLPGGLTGGLTGVLAAVLLAACAAPGPAADDGRTDLVATSYPLAHVAGVVGGERVRVANLTPPGADSHGLELTAQQVAALGRADVVVHLTGLAPAVDDAVDGQAPEHLVDAAALADRAGDPHVWLDPLRMADLGDAVAAELTAADPAGAAEHTAGAAALRAEMVALDAEHRAALAPCAGAVLVTAHQAFGYLAARYDLVQVGVTGVDPHVEPSPARLRDVVAQLSGTGVRTVFFETGASPAVAETLAAELGVATAVLDPVERVAAGASYPDLVRANLRALRAGLVCDAPALTPSPS